MRTQHWPVLEQLVNLEIRVFTYHWVTTIYQQPRRDLSLCCLHQQKGDEVVQSKCKSQQVIFCILQQRPF